MSRLQTSFDSSHSNRTHPFIPSTDESDNDPLVSIHSRASSQDAMPTNTNSGAGLPPMDTIQLGQLLTKNTTFYDIPMSSPFHELIEKYVPPPDRPLKQDNVASDEGKGDHNSLTYLIIGRLWRTVARYARQKLIETDASQLETILQLWCVRLLALTKLELYQLASAELEKLGNLERPEYHLEGRSIVPFELWVLWARLPAWLKHPQVTLERLSMLTILCKKRHRQTQEEEWVQREAQVLLILGTHMAEIGDISGAIDVMDRVVQQFASKNADIYAALGRLYLRLGDLSTTEQLFQKAESLLPNDTPQSVEFTKANRALLEMGRGEWDTAASEWQAILDANAQDIMSAHNLAVCRVFQGRLKEATAILEGLITQSQTSAGTSATLLQNLCILYELGFGHAQPKKVDVLKRVAHWAGDAFYPGCFRLQ